MEKKNENKAAAYAQIKALGGNSTESIKTIETGIGTVDVKVRAEPDFTDIKKAGGNVHERPYVYRATLDGANIPAQVRQKVDDAIYETAAAAFEKTKQIVEKYAEALKAVEEL